jgi:hypothetical protein
MNQVSFGIWRAPLRCALACGSEERAAFFAYPGTYSSARKRASETYRAIFSRPAQAGLTTSSVFICSAVSYAASAQTPCQHDDRQF